MKSKCCEADYFGNLYSEINFCTKCEKPCDLAPALRDSKEVLKRVEEIIKDYEYFTANNDVDIVTTLGVKQQLHLAKKLKQFIEGKE